MRQITPERQAAARGVYDDLVKKGYHPRAAARIVREAAMRAYRVRRRPGQGMGDASPAADVPVPSPSAPVNFMKDAADLEPIKAVREAISPWLWVTSVGGFVMALINTRRISKMFGDWKRRPRKVGA